MLRSLTEPPTAAPPTSPAARRHLSVSSKLKILLPLLIALAAWFVFLVTSIRSPRSSSMDSTSTSPSLRLVILSDTHRQYRQPIPHGDVLIHCGDSELSAQELDQWARTLPHPYKIAVAGNMDRALASNHNYNYTAINYLLDNSTTISGLTFYASPWTLPFVGQFQLRDNAHAHQIWSGVPGPPQLDVLITHGPPAGVLDLTSRSKRVGDPALLSAVNRSRPRLHCFGHIHKSYGTTRIGPTLFCNAAVFNDKPPIVVNLPIDRSKPATIVQYP